MNQRNHKSFRVLVMGLPGSGKTTFSEALAAALQCHHLNADKVREESGDWDFSEVGRVRQAQRMYDKAEELGGIVVADFVCPTPETRAVFDADIIILMDTIKQSRYADTNSVFVKPARADIEISSWEYGKEDIGEIASMLLQLVPQGVMIGRFQPFHAGHKALFEKIIERHGYCTIMVRFMPQSQKNPIPMPEVFRGIDDALRPEYLGRYCIMRVPNVAGVYYGRDVGYNVEKIELPDYADVSATKIREERGIVFNKEHVQ